MSNSDPLNTTLATTIDELAPAERIIRALSAALEADAVNRDGTRGPDHKTRVQAASLLLAYRVGRPLERQQVLTKNLNEKGESFEERLMRSPALRQAYREILDRVEGGNI